MDSEANTILVVDDTPITARWVAYVVSGLGFSAVVAFSGQEALSYLATQQFVTVISDVEMPRMNGFELLQSIRELYPTLPVILMSANCDDNLLEAARAWGAQALLDKPVNADQLTDLFGRNRDASFADLERSALTVPSVLG